MEGPSRWRHIVLAVLTTSGLTLIAIPAWAQNLVITTLAGTAPTSGYADGPGRTASFFLPTSVAADSQGNVFVADAANQLIRRIDVQGIVSTLAGVAGETGENDGAANSAHFRNPNGVAVDRVGNVFVADTDNCTIRRIGLDGLVSTLAGTAGSCGSTDGSGPVASFGHPTGLVVDGDGTIFVADRSNHAIRRITSDRFVSTFAGSPGQPGSVDGRRLEARFAFPFSITIDRTGNLYVPDTSSHTIRRISLDGTVTTFCGTPDVRGAMDGPCTAARFDHPSSLAFDDLGNLYVAESEGETIRRISPDGNVSSVAGVTGLPGYRDGLGSAAIFSHPFGLAVAPDGSVIIADTFNQSVRSGSAVPTSSRRRPAHR
ncbi:MAG: NHL repeat-containing protein [Acidobacteriota bacterium]